ncbi:hypothetical protein KC867_02565 [Candidatus Saccharibacteria bacterium]|nr:hypothetical protein [Candidatus Saccharibacteria bacterium]
MSRIKNKNIYSNRISLVPLAKEVWFALFLLAIVFVMHPGKASAATINVATGSAHTNSGDSICQLEEAVENINDGARTYTDCVESGSYGTNDTINLPAGTINNDGSGIYLNIHSEVNPYSSVSIIGQGKGVSILDGINFTGSGFNGNYDDILTLSDFTMRADQDNPLYTNIMFQGSSLTIERVEIDGNNIDSTGVRAENTDNVVIRDSYIHNFTDLDGSGMDSGILIVSMNYSSDVIIEGNTISQAPRGIATESYDGSSLGNVVLDMDVRNNTFVNINDDQPWDVHIHQLNSAMMIAAAFGGAHLNYTTTNNTFVNAESGTYTTAIFEYINNDNEINHTSQNDLYAVGNDSGSANYRSIDEDGSGVFSTTSLGGNVSSDNTYSGLLDDSSDQHGLSSLASFLGVLSDNGGEVPTIELLDGSPAIDAGTSVLGMSTDARGVSRPQGIAFDSGAYEKIASNGSGGDGNNGGSGNNGSNDGNGSNGANDSNRPVSNKGGSLGETGLSSSLFLQHLVST